MTETRWFGLDGGQVCRCSHDRVNHEHYRPGTDCSAQGCSCARFRRRWFATAPISGADHESEVLQEVGAQGRLDVESRVPEVAGRP